MTTPADLKRRLDALHARNAQAKATRAVREEAIKKLIEDLRDKGIVFNSQDYDSLLEEVKKAKAAHDAEYRAALSKQERILEALESSNYDEAYRLLGDSSTTPEPSEASAEVDDILGISL